MDPTSSTSEKQESSGNSTVSIEHPSHYQVLAEETICTPSYSPPKRLLVCCDGTWQASRSEAHHIPPTNASKLSRIIRGNYVDGGRVGSQVLFYNCGFGAGAPLNKYSALFSQGRFTLRLDKAPSKHAKSFKIPQTLGYMVTSMRLTNSL